MSIPPRKDPAPARSAVLRSVAMTPHLLRILVRDLDRSLPGVEDPPRLLRALEDLADRRPEDRAFARAVRGAHGLATAGSGLPGVVAGVRRETLVRWDGWTTTWDGPHLATGVPSRVRVLRPHAARDPVLRRALPREGRAVGLGLADLAVVHDAGAWPALRIALPGAPLAPRAGADDRGRPDVLVRMLTTAVADLARWESARLGLPALGEREWVDTPAGLRVICLTPIVRDEAGPHLKRLAATLHHWWGDGEESPVDALLDGFATFPPRTATEAGALVRETLARDLAATRHRLRRRAAATSHHERLARLLTVLARLERAVPLPAGEGPVGVDLEGAITVVRSDGARLRWGRPDALADVRPGGDLDVREARRLLRAHAAAPPNPRLASDSGGTLEGSERICRWLASALQARTVRLLLEQELPDRAGRRE